MRKDDVFRFDISMQNFLRVQVMYGIANLIQFTAGLPFLHFLGGFDLFIQGSLLHIFHEDVEIGSITEETIHFDYIRM